MDGLNPYRIARVAELLADFHALQVRIAAVPVEPPSVDDFLTEGWAALRQCFVDGQHILNAAADANVPETSGGQEQEKAELRQVHLDAYSRRHEGQKIILRQAAAARWIQSREAVLQGRRPTPAHTASLEAIDHQLRTELTLITDEAVYLQLQGSDQTMGRWTIEDPRLGYVISWVMARAQT